MDHRENERPENKPPENKGPVPSSEQSPSQTSYPQKMLKSFYDQCNRNLKDVFDRCAQLLDDLYRESAETFQDTVRDLDDANNQVLEREKEIELLKKRRSAREVMDRIGLPLARLYSDIDKLPEEETCKADLLKDLEVLDGAFKNCGIMQIKKLPDQTERNSENYKLRGPLYISDEQLIGKSVIMKVGFCIENEEPIPAEYAECIMEEKKPEEKPEKKPEEKPSQEYPFEYDTDFDTGVTDDGIPVLQLKSDWMCKALFDLPLGSVLPLNEEWVPTGGRRLIYRDPVSRKDFSANSYQINAVKLDENGNGELVLCVYTNTFFGSKSKENKFPLAYLPKK